MARNYPKKVKNKVIKNTKHLNVEENSGNRLF